MAGSYDHAMGGWSLVENMGDAHETVEELLWLVQSEIGTKKSRELLNRKYYPMARGDIPEDKCFIDMQKRMSR